MDKEDKADILKSMIRSQMTRISRLSRYNQGVKGKNLEMLTISSTTKAPLSRVSFLNRTISKIKLSHSVTKMKRLSPSSLVVEIIIRIRDK